MCWKLSLSYSTKILRLKVGPYHVRWEEGREGGSSELGSDEMRCELGSYEFK